MLFKVLPPGVELRGDKGLARMTVTYFAEMCLFQPRFEGEGEEMELIVEFRPPLQGPGEEQMDTEDRKRKSKEIRMPLVPDVKTLEAYNVSLHQSPTKAYFMGKNYDEWFSSCFGFEVRFMYLGPHRRSVLGNLSPNSNKKDEGGAKSWFSSIQAAIPGISSNGKEEGAKKDEEGITFADVAPYLIITEESLRDAAARMPEGLELEVTKFRSNIVVGGAAGAYDEDFWAGLIITTTKSQGFAGEDTIHATNGPQASEETELILTANCARCTSLNIDYNTGKFVTDQSKAVLKKLMKDRRVDAGTKYSPIFGRYGFLKEGNMDIEVKVGDDVRVGKRNEERTTFGEWSFGNLDLG